MEQLAISDGIVLTDDDDFDKEITDIESISQISEKRRRLKTPPTNNQKKRKRSDITSDEEEAEHEFSKKRARERADQLMKKAEKLKASIVRPNGKLHSSNSCTNLGNVSSHHCDRYRVYQWNEEYFQYTAHIDRNTEDKIKRGEFVELQKLLPRDKFRKRSKTVLSIRLLKYFVPSAMDELPIEQSRSQPVNPSHVTINGLSHYCTHNASVNNSI